MTKSMSSQQSLRFPFPAPPKFGELVEVAPGIRWLRMPLPFKLDHVNVYLLDDQDGTVIVDTGIGNDDTRDLWEAVLSRADVGAIKHVIATHSHPDHVGLAGWLCKRSGAKLMMSHGEYFSRLAFQQEPALLRSEPYRSFYLNHGLAPDLVETLLGRGHRYLGMVADLPRTFRRLSAGDQIDIGSRTWTVMTGGGHSDEQAMLHCMEDGIVLAADQIMARISPNVSVQAIEPDGDPLGAYIKSLSRLKEDIPSSALILPGHYLPFLGLGERADDLIEHHQDRCDRIFDFCRGKEVSVVDIMPVVFERPIEDPHHLGFAFGETLAHVNHLEQNGRLRQRNFRYTSVR